MFLVIHNLLRLGGFELVQQLIHFFFFSFFLNQVYCSYAATVGTETYVL